MKKTIAMVSHQIWHTPLVTRRQRFARFLSESGWRVLFIDPPFFITNRNDAFHKMGGNVPDENLIRLTDSLYVLVSLIPIPGRLLKITSKLERFRLWFHYANIRKALDKLKWAPPLIQWAYMPQAVMYKGCLKEKFYVFDWIDRFDSYPGSDSVFMARMEEESIRKADLIFATARGLHQTALKLNENSHFISNGVDFQAFQIPAVSPEYLKKYRIEREKWEKIAFFAGSISEWIDLDTVFQTARILPEILFLMVGPVDQNPAGIPENVVFTGPVPHSDVPDLISASDVCINPFRKSRLSRFVNPLKVYEYLAGGKPVVSTPMEELENIEGIIFAENPEEFAGGIREALKKIETGFSGGYRETARRFDWKIIEKEMLEIIEKQIS